MPTAAELSLILKFRDQATTAAKQAFTAVGQAAQQAANLPRQAFAAFEGSVRKINEAIRFTRLVLLEVTLAMAPFLGALAIAARNNTVVGEQFQRLQRTFSEVATQIGIRLLPVLQTFADWVQEHLPEIIGWFEQLPRHVARALLLIARMLAELAQSIAQRFPDMAEGLLVIVDGLRGAARAAREFGDAMAAAARNAMDAGNQVQSGINIALRDAYDSLQNFGNLAKDMATTGIHGLQTSMEQMFTGMITGSASAKEAFRNFGLSILQMLAQMIARLITTVILMQLLKLIPGVGPVVQAASAVSSGLQIKVGMPTEVKHAGGVVGRFHSGGEVPAILESGEFVVNKRAAARNMGALERMNQGGSPGGGISNVFIIQTNDAASFRGTLQQHADLIEGMIVRALRRNSGPIREAVRL